MTVAVDRGACVRALRVAAQHQFDPAMSGLAMQSACLILACLESLVCIVGTSLLEQWVT